MRTGSLANTYSMTIHFIVLSGEFSPFQFQGGYGTV